MLYETLEVSTRASAPVIRAAYRCLVQHHHPDKHSNSEVACQRLALINYAYSILSDPIKRQKYDASLGLNSAFSERRGQDPAKNINHKKTSMDKTAQRPFAFRPLI